MNGLEEEHLNRETIYSGFPRCVASLVIPIIRVCSQKAYSGLWLSSHPKVPTSGHV